MALGWVLGAAGPAGLALPLWCPRSHLSGVCSLSCPRACQQAFFQAVAQGPKAPLACSAAIPRADCVYLWRRWDGTCCGGGWGQVPGIQTRSLRSEAWMGRRQHNPAGIWTWGGLFAHSMRLGPLKTAWLAR